MAKQRICKDCGFVGAGKTITKGSIFIELVLWCFLLVPGLIYSIWRHTSRYDGCPKCGGSSLIPTDSPIGKKLMSEMAPARPLAFAGQKEPEQQRRA